jgi:hypothetical protein
MKFRLLFILVLQCFPWMVAADNLAEDLVFECKRVDNNFVEEYEMRLVSPSKGSKAKIFLDGRDLDLADANGVQTVKNIIVSYPKIVMMIEAKFEPETIGGISYPAGTVSTQISLDQISGQLKKVETIQGGILGANLGNGTHVSEETCWPSKAPRSANLVR